MAEKKKTTSAYGAGYKAGQETRCAIKRIKLMVEEQPRPGGAGRPDRFFALVARAYANHARYGKGSPIPWLAEQTGADRRTAENWVRQARKRGLLTDPTPGVGGGELTEKAKGLLAGDQERSG
ncbi:hypothetical protein [Streptosporangium sp. NPDC001681]|uniref:hypothetical protein n=1 Tax=Streptosporangium sp. NPDC001681 TaxID=3154395 RepID=UPI00331782AB